MCNQFKSIFEILRFPFFRQVLEEPSVFTSVCTCKHRAAPWPAAASGQSCSTLQSHRSASSPWWSRSSLISSLLTCDFLAWNILPSSGSSNSALLVLGNPFLSFRAVLDSWHIQKSCPKPSTGYPAFSGPVLVPRITVCRKSVSITQLCVSQAKGLVRSN